jgi:hypothetical protein
VQEAAASPMLVSFDIDGTMVFGEPPGPVPVSFVQAAIDSGHIVGSASDRTTAGQRELWAAHYTPVWFTEHKHRLLALRERFPTVVRFIHIGDTEVDQRCAVTAAFEFWHVDEAPVFLSRTWPDRGSCGQ